MLRTLTKRLFGGLRETPEDRLRKAKVIACDLDGTLLNRDEMVGTRTLELIAKIRSFGIHFILITRRHYHATELYAEEIRMHEPVIALDGAMARFLRGELIFNISFDQEFALDIIDETVQTDSVACCVVTPDGLLFSEPDIPLPSHHQHWNIETSVVDDFEGARGNILEVIATGSFHAVNKVFDYVNRKMRPGELKIKLYESHSHREMWHVEIRSKDATKQKALEQLLKSYDGISMNEVIGIGDHYNDLDFCQAAGYVVALENAVSDLKEIADFITRRNCLEEGINEFLEHFIQLRAPDAAVVADAGNEGRRKRSR